MAPFLKILMFVIYCISLISAFHLHRRNKLIVDSDVTVASINIVTSLIKCKQRKIYKCEETSHISNDRFYVRSNTRYVRLVVTPSAAWQLNCRLRPHRGIKGCGDHTIGCVGFLILESKGIGSCCYSMLLPQALIKD